MGRFIGISLMAGLFALLFYACSKSLGRKGACWVFGGTLIVIAITFLSTYLIFYY